MTGRRLLLAAVLASVLGAPAAARSGDNQTPRSLFAHGFESYLFQSPDNGWPDFLANLQGQGYIVVRHKNEEFDNDPEGVTIDSVIEAGGGGVFALLHVHGNTSGASLEVYEKTSVRDAAFDAYLARGFNPGEEIEIAKSDFVSGWWTFHNIRMRSLGFANRVKPRNDPADTLVYTGGVCNSAGFVDNLGGRVRFSNTRIPEIPWSWMIRDLLQFMSGYTGHGDFRSAGEAYSAGTYDAGFVMSGEPRTTLCPAVLSHFPTGDVGCFGGVVTGRIVLDTESAGDPATDLLSVSSNASLADAWWSDPGYELSFELGDVQPGETVTVTLREETLRSAANGAHLDGNQAPGGTDASRPNEDDFVWSFRCVQDADADGLDDPQDNCPTAYNPGQRDGDGNGIGDACDRGCTVHVDPAGGAGVDCTAIQTCIDRVAAGCRVELAPETYHERLSVDKPLTLVGLAGAGATRLVGTGSLPLVELDEYVETAPVVLQGLTLTGGSVSVETSAPARLEGVRIEGSAVGLKVLAPIGGGEPTVALRHVLIETVGRGIVAHTGRVSLLHSHIRDATGNGLEFASGHLTSVCSLITDAAQSCLSLKGDASATLEFSTVTGCDTGIERAAGATGSVSVAGSIVYANRKKQLSGVDCSGISLSDTDAACCGTSGNLCVDPRFVDAAAGDYHLQTGSPLVDAGVDPMAWSGGECSDHDGRPRLLDADGDGLVRADIGAFERPGAAQAPGEVAGLRFEDQGAAGTALAWDPEPASQWYRIYRGPLEGLGYDDWGTCLTVTNETSHADPAVPASGAGFFYLVTGEAAGEESTLGHATCVERANYASCP